MINETLFALLQVQAPAISLDDARFDAIMTLLKLWGGMASGVAIVFRYLKTLEVKHREKSVGASKIAELVKNHVKVTEDIEQLVNDSEQSKSDIKELKGDYRTLINNMFNYLGRK